jgi:hypothetical protein
MSTGTHASPRSNAAGTHLLTVLTACLAAVPALFDASFLRLEHAVFAFYVYPQEYGNPMVPPDGPLPPDPDPNHKLIASLSKTQLRAYQDADRSCSRSAIRSTRPTPGPCS